MKKNFFEFLSESFDSLNLSDDQIKSLVKFSVKIDDGFNKLISHYIDIDSSATIVKEFNIDIPIGYKYPLKKFEKGKSYTVILWNINHSIKNCDLHEKLKMEGCLLGGREGLNLLANICPILVPHNKNIFSLRTEPNRDVPSLIVHNHEKKELKFFTNKDFEHSLLFQDRKMSANSIIVSFRIND